MAPQNNDPQLNKELNSTEDQNVLPVQRININNLFRLDDATISGPVGIPEVVPAQTFIECRALVKALHDCGSTDRWSRSEGELALIHHDKGSLHRVRFDATELSLLTGAMVGSYEELERILINLDQSVVLLLYAVIAIVRELRVATLSIDDLVSYAYPCLRSQEERRLKRHSAVKALQVLSSLRVIGQRREPYRNGTDQKHIVSIDEPLIKLNQAGGIACRELRLVSIEASSFIARYCDRDDILTYFGDVRPIAKIPCKRITGALARDLGLVLLQYWREKAKSACDNQINSGEASPVEVPAISRKELLSRISQPIRERICQLMTGANLGRAQNYWDEAIKKLYGIIIGRYREPGKLSNHRKGSKSAWLNQMLDIQPEPGICSKIEQIVKGHSSKCRKKMPNCGD